MDKIIHELKAEFAYFCERIKKKINSLEIGIISFKVHKKCKSPIQLYKIADLLSKTSLFTLETILKMAKKENKGDVESTCARVAKHTFRKVAKAEVNLNYYHQLIMDCFNCIFISTNVLTYFIPILIFSLVS